MQGAEIVTLHNAATATGNGTALSVAGRSRVGLQVSGAFVATVTFEASINGSDYVTLQMFPSNSSTGATTATAAGIWTATVAGFSLVRARISAYTSGAVTVVALATDAAS
jgi:hypothetical protein